MSKPNASNVLTVFLLIVIAANPWVLKVALSSLLTFLLWLVGILVAFSLISYVVDMIRFDKTLEGEYAKSTKMEMLAKVSFITCVILAPIIYFGKKYELTYTFILLLIFSNVLFILSEKKCSLRQLVNTPLKLELRSDEEFSVFRALKLLAYCLIPFTLLMSYLGLSE